MSKALRRLAIVCVAASFIGAAGTAVAQSKSGSGNGQDDVKITHYNDWEVRCPKGKSSKGDCEMTQLINSPSNGKPIMRVVMGYPPQINTAAMIFILPLGTRLAPGVQLSVDGDKARRFPFQICLEQGCRADFPVDNALLNKMEHGHDAEVTIVGPKGENIKLKISLSGFTDANNAISS